jgi:hypothetical protein
MADTLLSCATRGRRVDFEGIGELPLTRFYYHLDGQSVVIQSADPEHVFTLIVGIGYFTDFRDRNPHLTFEYRDPRPQQ